MTTKRKAAEPAADEHGNRLLVDLHEYGFPMRVVLARMDHVHANPWNPNVMDDHTRRAIRESMATFGFIDPVTVREHPELVGHWQIVDGEHRWQELQELDQATLPVIALDVDTPSAMKLTVVFNESRGEADTARLGALLGELQTHLGDDLGVGLRYDAGTLKHLIDAGKSWDPSQVTGGGGFPSAGDGGGDTPEGWVALQLRMPESARDVLEAARAAAVQAGAVGEHDDEQVALGLLVEVLAAEYLAGAQDAG